MKNFTKQERTEIATAFKNAKQYLSLGEKSKRPQHWTSSFICVAIIEGDNQNRCPRGRGAIAAESVVMQRLERCSTVASWLIRNGHTTWKYLHTAKGFRQLQTYRHRWLDALIEEFSSNGKQ